MPAFELITITFSFVLGLGVARILASVGFVLRHRGAQSLHWVPLSVAGCIFLLHVQFWFALINLDVLLPQWSGNFYWPRTCSDGYRSTSGMTGALGPSPAST
jgi:hypothetical protein